jgi:hypothetical protein
MRHKGSQRYQPSMSKTPERMKAEAREYRVLHEHMKGVVLSDAIEQVAVALEQAADELEAEEGVASLAKRWEVHTSDTPK